MNIGAFGENFPYSNFHDLNMDWIIKIAKDFLDQYTSIQETIETGLTNLDEKTTEGLATLDDKATEIETLLNQWYTTHSQDIATELQRAIADFSSEAQLIASNVIASIPPDYTEVTNKLNQFYNYMAFTTQFLSKYQTTDNSCWFKNSNNEISNFTNNNCARYNRIEIKSGEKYVIVNCYAEFTFIADTTGVYITDLHTMFPNETGLPENYSFTGSFTAPANGYIYITRYKTQAKGLTNFFGYSIIPEPNRYGFFDTALYGMINPVSQLLYESFSTDNSCWFKSGNAISSFSNNNVKRYSPVYLQKDIPYYFEHAYAEFTFIKSEDGTIDNLANIKGIVTNSNVNYDYIGTYTPSQDCFVFVSRFKTQATGETCVYSASQFNSTERVEGFTGYYHLHKNVTNNIKVYVNKDGSGDFKTVTDAVNYINTSHFESAEIIIADGTYNILEELGGSSFLSSVETITSERQGLGIWRDNVTITGLGNVVFDFELPDNATMNQSSRTSCFNLGENTVTIKNITFIAKNCRYAIHDEANGKECFKTHIFENVRAIHKGNQSTQWQFPTVLGGGAGGGMIYKFTNCQFITNTYNQAFSYHLSNNLAPCHLDIDGCIGICANSNGYSFRFGYLGTQNKGRNIVNLKCCSGNGNNVITEEPGYTDQVNNIDLYINGWNTIPPIIIP